MGFLNKFLMSYNYDSGRALMQSVFPSSKYIGMGHSFVHSKTTILICYLLDYQQVRENTNVSIILLGDKKEPTK